MKEKQQNILIIGAGLCGSLLALRLGQRGYNVTVYEMRPDLRKTDISAGRSINLAFSDRGHKAMTLVGMQDKVKKLCIPMNGRMLHDREGNTFLLINAIMKKVSRDGIACLICSKEVQYYLNDISGHVCPLLLCTLTGCSPFPSPRV